MTSYGTGSVIEMKLPYKEPLVPAEPGERVIPEPPRRGEPGGEPCRICTGATTSAVWSNDFWTLHPPVGGSLAGAVWLASREHVDSFADLPQAAAEDFGKVAARVERTILSLGGIARVHLNRWGDGGAHFHVWFIPRPLGMLEAQGMMLPLWEDVLPNVPDEQLREAAERVAAMMDDTDPPAPQRSSAPVNSQLSATPSRSEPAKGA
ncbi:MAG: HIT family protein [Streptosporangiaceae bacterium]